MKNIEIQVVSILLINNGIPIETQLAYFIIYLIIPLKQEKKYEKENSQILCRPFLFAINTRLIFKSDTV